ncbi:MAG TPA: hypothetical protein VFK52_05935 [Nocardioidaceae bacterium]|nr:hypothetical protein [Nocardioidaceae bacterium]
MQLRLVGSVLVAGALVGGAVLNVPDGVGGEENPSLRQVLDRTEAVATAQTDDPHGDPFMEELHGHGDSAETKNAITRSPETGPDTADPTTEEQARAGVASVVRGRASVEPQLVPGFQPRPRLAVPEDRYAMAGGCYTIQAPSGTFVHRNGTKPTAVGSGAEPFHFQATNLGTYLVYGTKADFLGTTSVLNLLGFAPAFNSTAGPASDWTVAAKGTGFSFVIGGKALVSGPDGALSIGTAANATAFKLRTTSGCASWPEIETNVQGTFKGATSMQETRGYVDLHSHGMTHEFLGGRVLCGTPWHPYGVTHALVDCPDHSLTQGYGAILETFLAGGTPGHDTVGWPTFKYWPAPHSLTHQALYYKWLERSWRGGLRVFTNLLTENNVLCELYPLKKNSCNDMDAVRLQAKDVYAMQDYIDAQYGGPGRGWYRVVTDPFQARQIVNEGKLAVILGIETSVPFDCNTGTRAPKCTEESIDKALDEVYALGVRQLEITNKFDNGLTGVAGDGGTTGVLTNSANFYNTGHFLDMKACPESFGPGVQDNQQMTVPGLGDALPDQDAIFGAIPQLFGLSGALLPIYTDKPHCNQAGLTSLGEYLINAMIDRGMLFDPDHMSVIARKQALDLLEKAAAEGRHPGVLSSHSWSTPDAYPRIYRLGGMITPYAGDSAGFLNKWRQHLNWADPRYYFGFGYGADINGFGSQGDPRNPGEENDVDYPFTGLGGVTVDRERGGERVWDINTDGVAHYGLYPDWIEDVRVQAGGDGASFLSDMARGPEAFLQMWERALGVGNDGCRDAAALKSVDVFKALKSGMTTTQVLLAAGQPHTRLGTTYGYCARGANGTQAAYDVQFSASGKVTKVVRR